ncbi:MAG TPA: H-NS histone family protein [Methylocella sp.]|nr:H-NS histone family protein [Methylocella sp.]
MPALNLKSMDVDALLSLRADIDKKLHQKRGELEQQLSRLGLGSVDGGGRGGRGSAMKGRKVPPKYRGPGGETWAGRGASPRWLVALLKQGHKIEEFAINKLAAARKATFAKRSGRKRK